MGLQGADPGLLLLGAALLHRARLPDAAPGRVRRQGRRRLRLQPGRARLPLLRVPGGGRLHGVPQAGGVLAVGALVPLPDVDHHAHLVPQVDPPGRHRAALLHAHVQRPGHRPVARDEPPPRRGVRAPLRGPHGGGAGRQDGALLRKVRGRVRELGQARQRVQRFKELQDGARLRQDHQDLRLRHHVAREQGGDDRDAKVHLPHRHGLLRPAPGAEVPSGVRPRLLRVGDAHLLRRRLRAGRQRRGGADRQLFRQAASQGHGRGRIARALQEHQGT